MVTICQQVVLLAFRLCQQRVLLRVLLLALVTKFDVEHLLPYEIDLHTFALSTFLTISLILKNRQSWLIWTRLEPLQVSNRLQPLPFL